MPLPALPESNTARLFVNYTFGGKEHQVQFRLLSPFTQGDLITMVHDWLTDNARLFQSAVNFASADWAVQGSDIRNPVAWTPLTGSAGTLSDPANVSRSMTFVARSPDGRKLRTFFYGAKFGPDATYRVYDSEDAGL